MATLGTKRIFVTVGTTGFDELVAQVLSPTVLIQLAGLDFGEVMIQYGASRATFESYQPIGRIAVTGYAYKADVIEDMRAADLVISHG
ncbi:N-acetylglucosaminyldiphosphodolichol N-acetylglucosaminyltransferase catalytic subunit alg13, partial [Tieghemiomyces parasiticus]